MAKQKQVSKQDKRTLYLIGNAHGKLYSLGTLGELAERLPLDISTMYESVAGMCKGAREDFSEGMKRVSSSHPAQAFLKKADAALDALDHFMWMAYQGPEGDGVTASAKTRKAIGKVIVAFTGEAGRWMERAELAINPEECGVGYLVDGYMIDGGEGMSLPHKTRAQEEREEVANAAKRFATEVISIHGRA